MATDWAADVKKYAPEADDAAIAGIVRYCGIALSKVDSSLVAFSDPKELARVRNTFLKKKLGLTQTDKTLDAAIAKVGEAMKADRTKNRVTVYYLLAAHFKKLGLFAPKAAAAKKPAAAAAPKIAAVAAPAPAAKAPAKKTPTKKATTPATKAPTKLAVNRATKAESAPQTVMAKAAEPVAEAAAATPARAAAAPSPVAQPAAPAKADDAGLSWLWWVIGIAVLLFALWALS